MVTCFLSQLILLQTVIFLGKFVFFLVYLNLRWSITLCPCKTYSSASHKVLLVIKFYNFYHHWNSLYHFISHICGICIIPIGRWLVARQYVQVLVVSVLPSMPGFPRALVWTILCAVLASGDHNPGGKLHKLTLQRYFGFDYMTSCMAGTENPPVPLKAKVIRMLAGFLANMVEFEHCTWIFPWQVLSLLTKLLLLFTPSSLGFCFWHCVD